MKKIINLFLIAALALPIVSCRKELVYECDEPGKMPQNGVQLNLDFDLEWEYGLGYDWENSWNEVGADGEYESFRPKKPEGVAVILYEGEDNLVFSNEFHLGASGGVLSLPGDTRAILIHNDDSEYITMNSMASPHTAFATTGASMRSVRSSLDDYHSDERVVNAPDILYSAYTEVDPSAFETGEALSLKLVPRIYGYLIKFHIPNNNEYVAEARGSLAGMAESVYLKDGQRGTSKVTIPFDCELTSYGLGVHLWTFGVASETDNRAAEYTQKHDIVVDVRLKNGKILSYDFDVTDQLRYQPQGGVIFLDNLDIPDSAVKGGSGFETDVEDWGDDNNVDLPLH